MLVEGTYYLNRLFATIEYVPKTVVEVGTVGVVVSYTGESGDDLSGTDYKHGELVARGRRGVWSEPLLPGKYAFNTYAGRVIPVPTTNIILKWKKSEVGSHRLDENLAEVSLITKDAFEPSLPLSVVVHIDYREAPLVIQRFGDVKRLVEQTLDPMVAAYFKNVGQTRTLIELIHDRSEIQAAAGVEMKGRFDHYNLELEEVLIGTPSSSGDDPHIEQILTQLRSRQIASEQVETFARQKRAAEEERSLREAEARANQQQRMTEAEIGVEVNANLGRADYQRSLQKAAEIRAMADAEADRVRALATAEAAKVRALGEAEADKNARVGVAQAIAVEEQVRAYGGPRYQLVQQVMGRFSEAVEKGKIDVVPRIVLGGAGTNGSAGGGSNALEALLTLLLSERVGEPTVTLGERSAEATAVRQRLHAALTERREHESS
ncbi:MAG TPA: SPFH domain-containing protein [Polyangiaceae bacterium]|nr:SPFH domain-containing protein [Polyangiaceae bacterium]